jgi:hypothetical protein
MIIREPDREHRRASHVSLLAAEPVRALASLETRSLGESRVFG